MHEYLINSDLYYDRADTAFLRVLNDEMPVDPPISRISEYVEGKRILPPNTPFPGFWMNSRTPYLIELMDNMSPSSSVQHQALMKGAQIGGTAAAENILAYYMDEQPTEILFISATEKLIEKWSIKRLEPLIESCGFRHKIFAQIANKQSRRSGDKIYIKEYIGGCLDMASAQAAAALRSDSKRILIRDEIDGAPSQLRTGEGNWLDVSYARTNAWGHRRKVFDFSTPTLFDDSEIYQEYLRGDRRQYFVPCPHCEKYQVLEWGSESAVSGMKAETTEGMLSQVYYICDYCHEAIFNHHKTTMLNKGEWRSTSNSYSKFYRSYWLSSLYSPIGMLSWFELYEKYLKAQEDPDGMRSFVNLYLGKPYQEKGARPKLDKVIALRGGYKQRTVQDGILFITAGIDVQRGSSRDKNNPPRLEMEICGHGAGFRTWSLVYEIFTGEIDDPFSGAWLKLIEFAQKEGFNFIRDDGRGFTVALIFIDSGDGAVTDVVYRFCSGWQSTYPSKGFGTLKKQKKEKGDEFGPANFKRYRAAKVGEDITLYEISTNYYKTHLYNNLKIERKDISPQKPGFCDFPADYGEKYFKMLTAEEKRRDGSFYCPSGRRNEALDCRVLNQAAADVFLDREVLNFKARFQGQGARPDQLAAINHRYVLEYLTKLTARKV